MSLKLLVKARLRILRGESERPSEPKVEIPQTRLSPDEVAEIALQMHVSRQRVKDALVSAGVDIRPGRGGRRRGVTDGQRKSDAN